jgi:predicted nucleic acid-binding Zn ribbon protein
LQRMSEAALTDCPECGGHIHRVMQPVGVIFKGSGFYVTDNRGRSSTGVPAPKKKEDEGKTSTPSSESVSSGAGASSSNSSTKGGETS